VIRNHFTYVAQITFAKNYMAQYLVIIGYAFVRLNIHTLFQRSEMIPVWIAVRILLLNAINVFPRCSDYYV